MRGTSIISRFFAFCVAADELLEAMQWHGMAPLQLTLR